MHPEVTLTAVVTSTEAKGGVTTSASYTGLVTIGDRRLDRPSAEIEIEHELNHAVYDTAERYQMKAELEAIRQSVLALNLEYGIGKTGDECSDSYSAVLAIFDESTYFPEECGYGHPGQNATELFASALVCFTNFPNQVANAIKRLPSSERKAALQIARSCLKLSDVVAAKKGQPVLVDAVSPIRRLL